jgi:SAM-dependent methyltransferase
MDEYRAYNRDAWNGYVERGNEWTVPVSPEVIAAARRGEWSLLLIEHWPTPRDWFQVFGAGPDLRGVNILCLASGGGQQGPVLAAAGANVTVFDNSPHQLAQDQLVAAREGLTLRTVEGDMRDLSALADASFDLIFHPISNCYVAEVLPVWRECYRVLRPGGALLAGWINPDCYIFDFFKADNEGILEVAHKLPYADVDDLSAEDLARLRAEGTAFEWSHTWAEQLGGQLAAGFVLTDLHESRDGRNLESQYMPNQIATRAFKPPLPR